VNENAILRVGKIEDKRLSLEGDSEGASAGLAKHFEYRRNSVSASSYGSYGVVKQNEIALFEGPQTSVINHGESVMGGGRGDPETVLLSRFSGGRIGVWRQFFYSITWVEAARAV